MAVKKTVEKIIDTRNKEESFDYSMFDIVIERYSKRACEDVCDSVKEVLGLPSNCCYEPIEKVEAAEKIAKAILERAMGKIAYYFD